MRSPDGMVVEYFSCALGATGCNNEAEARAAIHALRWLSEQGVKNVLIHTDSSILAEQLRQPQPKRIARLAEIYERARSLLALFDSVQVQWIPRHKNTVADALARDEPVVAGQDRMGMQITHHALR